MRREPNFRPFAPVQEIVMADDASEMAVLGPLRAGLSVRF
jgi:hypothetical protein